MDNKVLTSEEQKEFGIRLIEEKFNFGKEEIEQLNFIDNEELKALGAIYISYPVKGGFGLIVGNDGQVLYANSSVSYNLHVEEYKKGRRTPF